MAVDDDRDGSVSPRTKTPQPAPSNIHDVLPPVVVTGEHGSNLDGAGIDAKDYWNGGSPHISSSPAGASKPAFASSQPSTTENGIPLEGLLEEETDRAGDDGAQETSRVPVRRRSVQFARPDGTEATTVQPPTHSRHASWEDPETPTKSRGALLMSRLKSLAGTTNVSSPRGTGSPLDSGPNSTTISPVTSRSAHRQFNSLLEETSLGDADADADVEETADEMNPTEASAAKKRRRRMRRPRRKDPSEPSTPSRFASDVGAVGAYNRLLRRRASMPDASGAQHDFSDAEPRTSIGGRGWRRGYSYMSGQPRPVVDDGDDVVSPQAVGRRAGHARRITVLGGGGMSDGDALAPRRPFFRSERASTYGAHKWRQVKNTLKLLRQKKEDRFDYYKSAELMAELRAGAPAVLILASMIQRDEHGNKRIPVLLEQLKLRITGSSPSQDADDEARHSLFTFELEYGSGPSRMSWTVTRSIGDIYNLHIRYRFTLKNEKYMPGRIDRGNRPKQPKFPYSAFPYLRKVGKEGAESDDDDQASARGEDTAGEATADEGLADGVLNEPISDVDGTHMPPRRRSRMNVLNVRRRSTGITDPGEMSNTEGPPLDMMTRRQRYVEKQRRILEKYLSEMIRWLMFRADSNRLCKFLELSALGVRLAAEGSYHGKEGYLYIQSSKGMDFRRVMTPAKVIARHSRKWFLVRQSYIVCIESPENMNIYDVYLVDSSFSIVSKRSALKQAVSKEKEKDIDLTKETPPGKHHTLTLHTSERKVRLFARDQHVLHGFEASITEMLKQTKWSAQKRFNSFAPVRTGVFAQWLVDGRDYMWNVSRAINMAKDVIYIHDWWLSPELYMRRPACISQKWRLDRLLQKKAREGVKIFVIIYRNVEAAIPIDSEYTKFSLLNLHPNIFVQRSPNQFKKNQFFFAHHEKICVVDHDVAFVGGIDLCFGRWDCPQHPIADDKPTGFEISELPKDSEHSQLFPGKDYSNPRVQDFFRLNEPYEEMYDRSKVPRMPWHDISMQVVGQPARDLTRHFVQRWNYLRRGRKPTRPLPFLLPPPDANLEELESLGLTGSCEVQILRSATTWSLGIEQTEHSIQTAYIKMIEDSEHFVYIENQFFISSTEVYNTRITNRIGDALVDRIIRAHENDEDWRCVIVIPLMPGFQNTVDEQEGTSVRLILMCQYRSICRGETSIFGRLRAVGIEPEDYISFYSLRQWGVLGNNTLVTEQLYIHAKAIIVDDRVALIGSANINERSMLGIRDSECAAIVRDTDMLWSTMAGKPYRVGRFAYTLRLRLMREHLGLDVDEILEQERQQEMDREAFERQMDEIYQEDLTPGTPGPSYSQFGDALKPPAMSSRLPSFNNDLDLDKAEAVSEIGSSSSATSEISESSSKGKRLAANSRTVSNIKQRLDVSGYGPDNWKSAEEAGLDEGRDSVIINGREVLIHNINTEGKGTLELPSRPHETVSAKEQKKHEPAAEEEGRNPPLPPTFNRRTTHQLGLPRVAQLPMVPASDDTDIGGPPMHIDAATGLPSSATHPMAADIKLAHIDKDCMRDPVNPSFLDEIWNRAAVNNTKLYRRVFRCMPDSEVSTWAEYREYVEYGDRFRSSMEGRPKSEEPEAKTDGSDHKQSTAAGAGVGAPGPEAVARAAAQEVEKLPKQLGEKVGLPPRDEKTEVLVPETGEEEFNEKQGLDGAGSPGIQPHQLQKVETDHEVNNEHMQAVSPSYSQGDAQFPPLETSNTRFLEPQSSNKNRDRRTTFSTLEKPSSEASAVPPGQQGSVKKRRRGTTKGSRRGFTIEDMPSRNDAEDLLKMMQGNLVQFPYDWLLTEEQNGNWGYQVDGVAPLAIYN